MSRALVLGGGGGVGAAWATGLVAGLARHGVDLSTAELVVGTSAGAVVGARLTSGLPIVDLAELEHDTPPSGRSTAPARMTRRSMLRWQVAAMLPGTVQRKRARVGRAALRAGTQPVRERLDHIARQLPEHDWPADERLALVAVDARTGAHVVFTRASGAPLVRAVAASCAVPMLTPPIEIDGRHYVDGGVRSLANVDLAAGHDRVVVVAPLTGAIRRLDRPDAQLAALGATRSVLITPDEESLTAIGGLTQLRDPARRPAAAQAGLAQAATVAERVQDVWTP